MKKWLALLLAVVMLFALVACDKGEEKKEEETINISRGTIESKIYTNTSLGVKFTMPDGWRYYTDAEIASLLNMSADMMFGENFKNALKNSPTVFDMMAVEPVSGTNVQVLYENLSKTAYTDITVEQYIEILEQQLKNASGMSVTFPDTYETVKLGNTEFTKVECQTVAYGVSMTQVYYLYKLDGFMCSVIVTIATGYTVADIEAMFS